VKIIKGPKLSILTKDSASRRINLRYTLAKKEKENFLMEAQSNVAK